MSPHPTPWTVDQSYKQDDPWISIVDANGSVVLTTTEDADLPLTQELAYRIVAAVNEVERLRAELDRADPHAMTLLEQAVDRLEAERQAILDAGGEALWAGGAKTLPEAVAGALHALDVALTRSAKEYDASPAAKVRDTVQVWTYTDADLVRRAVENAGSIGGQRFRRAAVALNLGIGLTSASALCRACGLDPDEMVGDGGEEDAARNIIRLRGEDCLTDDDAGGGWTIDGVDGYEPPFGTGTTWDTAEDAMAEHPGKWWFDEPGCWLCYAEDLGGEGDK